MARYPRHPSALTAEPLVPTLPPKIEKVYRLSREGGYGNCRVEELTIQGDQVIERKFVSERDARPFAMARIMTLIEERVRREYP